MGSQYKNQAEIDEDNSIESDNVVINGFCFCLDHGLEYCPMCTVDYRMVNNVNIETLLEEKVPEEILETNWEGDDREPFDVAYQWTCLSNGKPGCINHEEVGCQECFNWDEKILSEVLGESGSRRTM